MYYVNIYNAKRCHLLENFMPALKNLYQKNWVCFTFLWLVATVGYVVLQEVVPVFMGKLVGWIYSTDIGFSILDSNVLDFLFSALVWSVYGGILLSFLTLVFVAFFYTQINFFALFEHHFNWADTIRTTLRFLPCITGLALAVIIVAAIGGFLNNIIPSPFSASWITNFLFSLFFASTAFFTTADIISNSLKDAVLNTARLTKEYWKIFLFMLLSCTILPSLLGGLLLPKGIMSLFFQLVLSGIGFAVYGALGGFLFDFFIRNKDPFLFKQQAQETGLESI